MPPRKQPKTFKSAPKVAFKVPMKSAPKQPVLLDDSSSSASEPIATGAKSVAAPQAASVSFSEVHRDDDDREHQRKRSFSRDHHFPSHEALVTHCHSKGFNLWAEVVHEPGP
eukprot:PhM_4_TR15251/c0_g1_i3/m.8450